MNEDASLLHLGAARHGAACSQTRETGQGPHRPAPSPRAIAALYIYEFTFILINMIDITDRERQVLAQLRADPLLDAAAIARRLGTTRAAVAVHLSALTRKGYIAGRGYVLSTPAAVVVAGGANLDIKCRTAAAAIPGTSNPGSITTAVGGVGRNVAETLARLGVATQLLSVVGEDEAGDRILRETAEAGVDLSLVLRSSGPTGVYTAVLDAGGDLVVAVSAMDAMADLTPARIAARAATLARAALIVADANLPAETLLAVAETAAASGVRCVLEPVSVPKAGRFAAILERRLPVFLITPNRDELAALTGRSLASDADLAAAAEHLHVRGVEHLAVGLGARGAFVSTAGAPARRAFVPPMARCAADVTGGGDAALAATVWALLQGHDLTTAARAGQAAAGLAVSALGSTAATLDAAALTAALTPAQPLETA